MEYETKKSKKKTVTFRIDEKLLAEFRLLCNFYDVKQVAIIENAMRETINNLKCNKKG
jgi:hypothetical protein